MNTPGKLPTANIIGDSTELDPEVDAPGTYQLTILNTLNGCEASNSILVVQDVIPPTLEIQDPEQLTCVVDSVNLTAVATNAGNNFEAEWTTVNGNLLSGDNSLMPLVNAPGTYTLNVLNPDNLCSVTASVVVTQDVMPPIAVAGSDFVLPCFEDSAFFRWQCFIARR